jgi:hypothetical protein
MRSIQGLGAGYLTDYDAELERWLKANPNVNPNAPGSGVPVNPTAPVANAGSSMLMDFINRRGDFSATVNLNAKAPGSTVPLIPLNSFGGASQAAPPTGMMCPQVLKQCADGSQVGYDLKVKDRCVYLPCPSTASSGGGADLTGSVGDAVSGWFNGVSPMVLLSGAALLVFMFLKR